MIYIFSLWNLKFSSNLDEIRLVHVEFEISHDMLSFKFCFCPYEVWNPHSMLSFDAFVSRSMCWWEENIFWLTNLLTNLDICRFLS